MTVKRKHVDEAMFMDRTLKNVKVDMDRAGQMVADMAYHGSQFQHEQLIQQDYHAQFAPPAQMAMHSPQDHMVRDDAMDTSTSAAVHHVPTHRFISSCVSY